MSRGHRALPHTADVVLEAWGPDLAACCEEAVAALVDVFVDRVGAAVDGRHEVHLPASPVEDLVVDLLDEVIFVLDTADDQVPVGATVHSDPDGDLRAVLALVDREGVGGTGSVPKAISRSELAVESSPAGTRCRVLVDV
jgi:SHS2 domain-containing protein